MPGYIEKKYASLDEAKSSAAWFTERFGGVIFKAVDIGGHNNFRVGVFNEKTGELMQYESEWVDDCPSCGASVVVTSASERGGDILCDECAKTVGVFTGEPQHEPR